MHDHIVETRAAYRVIIVNFAIERRFCRSSAGLLSPDFGLLAPQYCTTTACEHRAGVPALQTR